MKKALTLLVVLLMCLYLCACNNGTVNDNTNDGENPDEHTHVWSDWETVSPATCTSEGLQQRTCSCGEIETEWIPTTGHNEVIDEAVAASCTENGLTEGKHCATCGEIFVAQETIPAKHQYVDKVCLNCGQAQPVSEGLLYERNEDGVSFTVVGIGNCTDTDILIPDTYKGYPVTGINGAFRECGNLTSIFIPDTVTRIDGAAFADCNGLTSLVIPDSVTYIGNEVFLRCNNLTSVVMPSNATRVGENAFLECYNLTSIVIPYGVTEISYYLFDNCGNLNNIIMPETVLYIQQCAFRGCVNLEIVTIPEGVSAIEGSAFDGCSGLTTVTLPSSISYIGNGAFSGCDALTDIYYNGTYEQWKALNKGSNWLDTGINFTLHCTDGDYSRYE